jgi:hypothetical protein
MTTQKRRVSTGLWLALFVVSLVPVAVLTVTAGGLLEACSSYSCNYKGTEYHINDTWTDGCLQCHCPPEGTKSVWCTNIGCSDAGTDGGGNDADAPDR